MPVNGGGREIHRAIHVAISPAPSALARLLVRHESVGLGAGNAADPHTLLPAGMEDFSGIGVDGVELVAGNIEAAGTAELLPLHQELAVLVEDLDAVVD